MKIISIDCTDKALAAARKKTGRGRVTGVIRNATPTEEAAIVEQEEKDVAQAARIRQSEAEEITAKQLLDLFLEKGVLTQGDMGRLRRG